MGRIAMAVVCLSVVAFSQSTYSGRATWYGVAIYGAEAGYMSGPPYAAVPTVWVNNQQCNHTFGGGDTDHTLSPVTVAKLQAEYNSWLAADDGWWRVKVPHGSLLNSSSFNGDTALLSLPGKTGTVTKCFIVESDTPLAAGQTACSHGLPGFGGTRNPGCDGHVAGSNDVASMWTLRMDQPGAGFPTSPRAIYYPGGYGLNPTNHVVLRDMELTIQPGTWQSGVASGGNPPALIVVDGDQYSRPHEIGIERSYLHGWDPEPVGAGTRAWDHQPTGTGPGGSNACINWTMSGWVDVISGSSTVTWHDGKTAPINGTSSGNSFGMTFPNGTLVIDPGGQNISTTVSGSFDPTINDTTLTLTSAYTGTTGTYAYTLLNPPSLYAVGCGDDLATTIKFRADNAWFMWNYIEKIHAWGFESHDMTFGFSSGPNKINGNWMEGGSGGLFSGGGAVDQSGGPIHNVEIRKNYLGRDLNWRNLTGGGGGSPQPPFGCAALSSNGSKKNCPFAWAVKNSFELKLCVQCVIDGNIIEGSWPDGQDGKVILQTVRTISGGEAAGIFDLNMSSPTYGQPLSAVHDVRYSNNWIRNSSQGVGAGPRSGGPGNGGGVSQPTRDFDFINNAFTNIGDAAQFGPNGNANLFESWGSNGQSYTCAMSRAANVAHAACQAGSISTADSGVGAPASVSAVNGLATVSFGSSSREDPMVGGTVVVSGPNTSWNTASQGSPIVGVTNGNSTTPCNDDWTNQPCIGTVIGGIWINDGRFGTSLQYCADGSWNGTSCSGGTLNGTLCSSASTCKSSGIVVAAQTLAYKITDISVGDGVNLNNVGGGDTSCTSGGYIAGSANPVAIAPTNPAGLDVYYANSGGDDPGGSAICVVSNSAGWPGYASFMNNDVVVPTSATLTASNSSYDFIYNCFENNIFAETLAGQGADFACSGNGEGTQAFNSCWDTATLQFGGNVLQGRSASNWSVFGGLSANGFPANASCSGSSADSSCIGWTKFMSGVSFPTTACSDASAPFNCPLMTLPWADNLRLSDLALVGSSSWTGLGANITDITNAMTANTYVCPAGLNCGSSGPYPDN